jgi:predicted phage tail protein
MPHMTRLILMAALVAAILAVINFAWGPTRPVLDAPAQRSAMRPVPRKKGDTLPATFQTIAYVLLIVLMFGVATGWLGAA